MASKIDPTQINAAFPTAKINQPSQGFRSNFSSIQTNFSIAKSEIGVLQSTTINVSGDVQNTNLAPVLSQPSTLSIPLVLSLKDVIGSAQTIDTSLKDYSLSFDTKGRITSIVSSDKGSYSGDANPKVSIKLNPDNNTYPNYQGISSISVPIFQINDHGILESQSYQTLTGFGLLGYGAPKGQMLVGNSLGLSTFTDIPTKDNMYLISDSNNDTGLSWKELIIPDYTQGITEITDGQYIKSTIDGLTATISTDYSSVKELSLDDTDDLIAIDTNNLFKKIKISEITGKIDLSSYMKKLSDDKSPVLSGNLDTGSNKIISQYGVNISTDTGSNYFSSGTVIGSISSIQMSASKMSLVSPSVQITSNQNTDINCNGNLSVESNSLTISNTNDMALSSKKISVTGTDLSLNINSLTINNIKHQVSLPTNDNSLVVYNKDGSSTYTTIDGINKITDISASNGIKSVVTNNVANLKLDYSNMAVTSNSTIDENTDIVVYNSLSKDTILIPASGFVKEIDTKSVYVSNNGDDTSGDGSIYNPYKTITKGISKSSNVIIFSGLYSENITISTPNVVLKSYIGNVNIYGSINFNNSISNILIENIDISYSSEIIVYNSDNISNVEFRNCSVAADSTTSNICSISKSISGNLIFKNCSLQGTIENNSTTGNILIDGNGSRASKLRISLINSSSIEVKDFDNIISINHTSGNIFIDRVNQIYDNEKSISTDTNGNTIYSIVDSIISTADTGLLSLRNSNMIDDQYHFSTINKTGKSNFIIDNVLRNITKDIINGTPLVYDIRNVIYDDSITTTTYSISPYNSYHEIKTNIDTMLSISDPDTYLYEGGVYLKLDLCLVYESNKFTFDDSIEFNSNISKTYEGAASGNKEMFSLLWDNDSKKWICYGRLSIIGNDKNQISRKNILTIKTDSQSVFDVNYVDSSFVDVYLNGILLSDTSYTLTDGTTLTLSTDVSTNIKTTDTLTLINS